MERFRDKEVLITGGLGFIGSNLATELYSSATSAADAAGKAIKFSSPVVANGHVYVNGDGVFSVYAVAP